MATDSGDRLW